MCIAATLIVFITTGCNLDEEIQPSSNPPIPQHINALEGHENAMKLKEEPNENPYEIENMEKALEKLKEFLESDSAADLIKGKKMEDITQILDTIQIEPTHYYVKFTARDSLEWIALSSDTTLILFDHPLEYDVEEDGVYRDPNTPKGQPTPQYTVIEKGHPLDHLRNANVEIEIIDEMYMPIDDEEAEEIETKGKNQSLRLDLITEFAIQNLSMALTDNLTPEDIGDIEGKAKFIEGLHPGDGSELSWGWFKRFWRWVTRTPPAFAVGGRLRYEDNTIDEVLVPLAGVQVRAYRNWWIKTAISGDDGYFYMPSSHYQLKYSVKWQREHFEICPTWGWSKDYVYWTWSSAVLSHLPGKHRGYILHDFKPSKSKFNWYCATIHLAANQYFYGNRHGLKFPYHRETWRSRLSIFAIPEIGTSTFTHRFTNSINIREYLGITGSIYGTVIHEIAHASHYDNATYTIKYNWNSLFQTTSFKRLQETFARGVQWRFYYGRYNANETSKPYRGVYTGLIQDLIDNDGVTGFTHFREEKTENVSGYKIAEIESAVRGAYSFEDFRNNLMWINNKTRDGVRPLFDYWDHLPDWR